LLAYEREMLRRWRKKIEARARAGKDVVHRISHDDMTINVNWETASDRRHTQLNCAVTADATSGYVYRMDVDFDPRVEPLKVFKESYLTPRGRLKNLRKRYNVGTSDAVTLPLLAWQRPTGRLHEPQFFAAGIKELEVFLKKLEKRHPQNTPARSRPTRPSRSGPNATSVRSRPWGWGGSASRTRAPRSGGRRRA
jgi:hypothetical protein